MKSASSRTAAASTIRASSTAATVAWLATTACRYRWRSCTRTRQPPPIDHTARCCEYRSQAMLSPIPNPAQKASPASGLLPISRRHCHPSIGSADLQGPEAPLVIHLRVSVDPEAEIKPGHPAASGQFNLLQDRERAQAARGLVGIVERVDGGNAVRADVGHGHRQQALFQPHLHEQGGTPRRSQEATEVAGVGVVHATTGVPILQVALVQGMAFVVVAGHAFADDEVGVALSAAYLRAIGLEVFHVDATRGACAALLAMRKIQMAAGATEAAFERGAIQLVELRRRRIEYQVLGGALGVVAAGMRQGLEQADRIGAAHGLILCRLGGAVPARRRFRTAAGSAASAPRTPAALPAAGFFVPAWRSACGGRPARGCAQRPTPRHGG